MNWKMKAPHPYILVLLITTADEVLSNGCRTIEFLPGTNDKVLVNHLIRRSIAPNKDVCEIRCYNEPNCVSYNYGPADSSEPLCDLNVLSNGCRTIEFLPETNDKVLVNHLIRSSIAPNKDVCEIRCYGEPNCVSYNFGPVNSSTPSCDLNNSTHLQVSSSDFVMKEGYTYRHILNACESSQCQNNATCQAGFQPKGYRCVCPPGCEGDHCESDLRGLDLLALYPFNTAYTTKDLMGIQPEGIPSNVHLADGPHGEPEGSYQFMGTIDSFIELPNNGGLDTQSITILMWVYPEGQDGPLFNYKPGGGWLVHLWIVGGNFFCRFNTRDGLNVGSLRSQVLSTGQWSYVGASYDYNTGINKLWVDEVEVGQANFGIYLIGTNDDVRVGAITDDHANRHFKGRIARVQVYSTALNQEQVLAAKTRGRG